MSFTPYATVEEAQAYFDLRLNTGAWDDAVEGDKTKALSQATLIIDRLPISGDKYDPLQSNEFPREDGLIPEGVQFATAEIAIALLDGVDPEIEMENLKMLSQSYSTVRSTYDRSLPSPHILAGVPSAVAWQYLMPYLVDISNVTLYRV